MTVAEPIIGWLLILALFYEIVAWMVNRWGPM